MGLNFLIKVLTNIKKSHGAYTTITSLPYIFWACLKPVGVDTVNTMSLSSINFLTSFSEPITSPKLTAWNQMRLSLEDSLYIPNLFKKLDK